MSEWPLRELGEFVDVKHGYAFKGKNITSEPTSMVLVTPGNFRIGGGFKTDKLKYYAGTPPKEYVLSEGDLVVTMTDLSKEGDTLGYGALVPSIRGIVLLHNQRIGLVENNSDKLDSAFLHWFLRTKNYHLFILGAATGTSVRHTSPTTIKSTELRLPEIVEQRAIASVLNSLDDKIDLLHRQNKTLEALAETLFRQWFIEEAQDDWKEGVLPDEFDFTMGQSPPGSSFNENGDGIAMFQGNADFTFRFPQNRVYTSEAKRYAEPLDTLISVRAPVGAQNMAAIKCCIGRGLSAFRYRRNPEYHCYTYYKLRSLMDEIKQFNSEGTVFGSISKAAISQLKSPLPPVEVVERFQTEVQPIDGKVIANCNQIILLEKLRDTLLPKLMSGEVRVI